MINRGNLVLTALLALLIQSNLVWATTYSHFQAQVAIRPLKIESEKESSFRQKRRGSVITNYDLESAFSQWKHTSRDKKEKLMAPFLLSSILDMEADAGGYFKEVPKYRLYYILEMILPLAKKESATREERYKKLQKKYDVKSDEMTFFTIDWKRPTKKGRALPFWQKISRSQSSWKTMAITFFELPSTYQEFTQQIYQKINNNYHTMTRQKVMNQLIAEFSPQEFAKVMQPDPGKTWEYYRRNRNEFSISNVEFTLKEIVLNSDLGEEQEVLKKHLQAFLQDEQDNYKKWWQKEGLHYSELMQLQQTIAKNLPSKFDHYLQQKNISQEVRKKVEWQNHNVTWPYSNKLDQPNKLQRVIDDFATQAPLGKTFMPKAHFVDDNKNEHVLFMISEERTGNITAVPFSSTGVQKRIILRERITGYSAMMKKLVVKLFSESLTFITEAYDVEKLAEIIVSHDLRGLNQSYNLDKKVAAKNKNATPETTPSAAIDDDEDFDHRFPNLYNPNPLAGRLYLQPIGPHEDRVIKGLTIDAWLITFAEYNRYFHDGNGVTPPDDRYNPIRGIDDNILHMNGNVGEIRIGYGFKVRGLSIETGGVFRLHVDRAGKNTMSVFLVNFHNLINSDGHIPDSNQPISGEVGDSRTVVIDEDGGIYMASAELYGKIQLLKERGIGIKKLPNLALKVSVKVPTSGRSFDTLGVSLSAGVSKRITGWLKFIGAASVTYQDISNSNFDASENFNVESIVFDLYAGFVFDPGKTGGFYWSLGMRYSSKRIYYLSNELSGKPAVVIHIAINYSSPSGRWNPYFFASEELPDGTISSIRDGALEPDFLFGAGMAVHLNKKKRRIEKRHE